MEFSTELKIVGLVFLLLVGYSSINVNSYKTSITTSASSATVSEYVAVAFATYFTSGINFGTVVPNTIGNNATNNSLFTVTFSADTNVATAEVCVNSSTITSGGNIITQGNFSYNSSTNQTILNTTELRGSYTNFTSTSTAIPGAFGANSVIYWRFKLDVPDAQLAGSYAGTTYFEGVSSGAC
ncbi:Uncharacterised protein [uncultured archaeon]|nr:Uncharacterised protein [uncultured archaeon]